MIKRNYWLTRDEAENLENDEQKTIDLEFLVEEIRRPLKAATLAMEAECVSCRPGVREASRREMRKHIKGAQKLCESCHMLEQGGITYAQAHEKGTPKELNAQFDAKAEQKKAALAGPQNLIKMHAAYDGKDQSSAKSYLYPHHGGEGAQPVFKTAVVALAKQLGLSDVDGEGAIQTRQLDNPLHGEAVARAHMGRHLRELS